MEVKCNCIEAKINVQKTSLYRKVKQYYEKKGCSEVKVKEWKSKVTDDFTLNYLSYL